MTHGTLGTRLVVPLDELSATGQQFRGQAPQIAEQVRAPLQATEQTHGLSWSGQAREQYLTLHQPLVQALDHLQARVGTLGTQLGHHASYYAVLNAMRFGGTPGAPTVAEGLEPTEDERVAGNVPQVVTADPENPAPFNTTDQLPSGVDRLTLKIAKKQQAIGGKGRSTMGGALVVNADSQPYETPIMKGNQRNQHAEPQAIRDAAGWLSKPENQGDIAVDIVTENLPCSGSCTPSILDGSWYKQLGESADATTTIDLRVWHHRATPNGELTLFAYELPPDAKTGMRRLYISSQMRKKMAEEGLVVPTNVQEVSHSELEQFLA